MEQKTDELTSEQFATQLRLLNVDPKFFNKAVSLLEIEEKYKELSIAASKSSTTYQTWIASILRLANVNEATISVEQLKELGTFKLDIAALKNDKNETTHINFKYEQVK